jgi:hypothetical protein
MPRVKSNTKASEKGVAPSVLDAPEIRKADGRWQKGISGNPGGQPKGMADVKRLARSFTQDAIATLAEIMKDTEQSGPARVSAATALLDRGYGKPLQQMEVGKPGEFADMSDDQVDAFIRKTVAELSAAKAFVMPSEDRSLN